MLCRAFIGRDVELAQLRAAWSAAREGSGSFVVVRGVAGVGKSRLVRELEVWARSQGGSVLRGRASPGTDSPLRPLREALLGVARTGYRPSGVALEPFLPALGHLVPDWATLDAVELSPVVVGEGVLRLLAAIAEQAGPALLVVDDLHWADPDTAAVVEYLADNATTERILVVATVRDGEVGPGADACERIVARRVGLAVSLVPLADTQLSEMIQACVGDDSISPEVVRSVARRSDGVPFFVEELLASALSTRTLDGVVPESVRSAVAMRLAALPDVVARLLRVAALLGRSFDWSVAASAASISPSDAPDLLRLAVRAQLLEVDGAGFRFRHDLSRDAVLADIVPGERAAFARAAMTAMLSDDVALAGERAELAATMAAEAGESERAAELLVAAARRALREGSLASAEALANRAKANASSTLAPAEVDALLLEIWSHAGRTDDVLRDGERLVASFETRTAPADEVVAVHLLMARAALTAGRYDEVAAHVLACREVASDDLQLNARVGAIEAHAAIARDDVVGALRLAEMALAAAEATGLTEVQCEALEVIGRSLRVNDVAAAETAFDRAYRVAVGAELTIWRIRALQELGTIDLFESLSTHRLEQARDEAVAAGALSMVAVIDLQLGATYCERADVDRALVAAGRSVELSRRLGLATLAMGLAMESFAHARAGLQTAMEDSIAAALATGADRSNVESGIWGNARATFYLSRGELGNAAVALDRCMDVLRAHPGGAFPFTGMWPLVHTVLDDVSQHSAREEVRAMRADTPVSRQLLTAADAVAAGRAGDPARAVALFAECDSGLARFEGNFRRDLMRLLVAPCALADGWGEPVVWLRETLARFEAKGLTGFADTCRALLRDAGVSAPRRTPGRAPVPVVLAALGITPREVEVLALVAAGHSNREVAQRLFLSLRTVEKHVERVLMKAGTDRSGLAALAARAGIDRERST
jgi:DNA-binding CsgD family transcriptional regulator